MIIAIMQNSNVHAGSKTTHEDVDPELVDLNLMEPKLG